MLVIATGRPFCSFHERKGCPAGFSSLAFLSFLSHRSCHPEPAFSGLGVTALACGSSLGGSSWTTSTLFAFLRLTFVSAAVTPGRWPETVAFWTSVSSTKVKRSMSAGLGFLIGTVLDFLLKDKADLLAGSKVLTQNLGECQMERNSENWLLATFLLSALVSSQHTSKSEDLFTAGPASGGVCK